MDRQIGGNVLRDAIEARQIDSVITLTKRISKILLRGAADRDDRALIICQDLRKFVDRFRPHCANGFHSIENHRTAPFKTLSTRRPISSVLVTVCLPISVQDRRLGKIFSGLSRPLGLKTALTRSMVSRSDSEKTMFMYSFFSNPMPCSPLSEPPTSTQTFNTS